eukprot:scaffold291199_cov35-Tisochrysis_lutea.AAC.1
MRVCCPSYLCLWVSRPWRIMMHHMVESHPYPYTFDFCAAALMTHDSLPPCPAFPHAGPYQARHRGHSMQSLLLIVSRL